MNYKKTYYSPTGKIDLIKVFLCLLLIAPIWMLSFLYAGILYYNPIKVLNILPYVVFVLTIYGITQLAVEVSNTRNRKVAIGIGVVIGTMAIYFSWANFFAIWGHHLPTHVLIPEIWIKEISRMVKEGSYSILWIHNDGFSGVIIWLIESLGIGFAVYLSSSTTTEEEIYCENCRHWVSSVEDFFSFKHGDKTKLINQFENQDDSFLADVLHGDAKDVDSFSIEATCCHTCQNSNYLSLTCHPKDEDSIEETPVLNLQVDQSFFDKIADKSGHFKTYTQSEKYSHGIWFGIPLVGLIVFLGAIFYQKIAYFAENYFVSLVLFVGAVVLLFLGVREILKLFLNRNTLIARLFGILVGTMVVYLTHVALFYAEFNEPTVFSINMLWVLVNKYMELHEWEWMGWFGFFIESFVFFIVPIVAAESVGTSDVFCEKDKKWAEQEDDLLVFNYPDIEELKYKFTQQRIDFLDKIVSPDNSKIYYRINGEWCDACNDLFTLTLDQVTVSKTADGYSYSFDTLHENVIVSKETFEAVKIADKPLAKTETDVEELSMVENS